MGIVSAVLRVIIAAALSALVGSCSGQTLKLHAVVDKPSVNAGDAEDICLPQAKTDADIAGFRREMEIRQRDSQITGIRCEGNGFRTECSAMTAGPGDPYTAMGKGMMDAKSISDAKEAAGRATLARCLAQYGYTFTVEEAE